MENIFDSHAHYADNDFKKVRDELLATLPDKGVKYVMLASTNVTDTVKNLELARKYSYIWSSSGIHPSDCEKTPAGYLDLLRETANDPKVRAIGEIGLDYHYQEFSKDIQMKFFTEQLDLAKDLNKPVIIHSRDACEDTMEVLRKYRPEGVMHCFSYSAEIAKEIVKLGMYVGFTGVVTFKNANKTVKAVEAVPLDRLLLETDCPYMAPEPFRGQKSESSMIAYTAAKIAEIKGLTTQEILDITCENAKRFYGIEE